MSTKITYTRQGDYNLPNLMLPEQDDHEIGIWGQRRRRFLKEHHRVLYYNLLTKCKLHDHLDDINEEATELYNRLVKQLAEQEGITEQLKANNQILWAQQMNSIRNRVQEIVNYKIINN